MASIPALEILNEIFSVADAMRKILIIGNSGSGKSWLGKRLATVCNVPYVALDRLFWEPGGYNVKRCKTLVAQDLTQLQGTDTWLIEGVFGQMAEDMLPYADTLFFLDLPWEECRSNLLARGSESARQRDPAGAEQSFQELLAWAAAYDTRKNKNSGAFHRTLFEQFTGRKQRATSRQEMSHIIENARNALQQ